MNLRIAGCCQNYSKRNDLAVRFVIGSRVTCEFVCRYLFNDARCLEGCGPFGTDKDSSGLPLLTSAA
jgi:hypothetical protein